MLRYLNVDYRGDEEAFGHLIRGRELAETFADRSLADQIYKTAEETGADASFMAHQRANFELYHPNGSTRRAMDALNDAEKHAKRGTDSIAHTRAMVLRKMASQAQSEMEKEKYRRDAKEILQKQVQYVADPYPFTGLGEVLLDELRDKLREGFVEKPGLAEDRLKNRVVTDLIAQTEEVVSRGLQKFPGDEYLLTLHANLSTVLQNEPRAIEALTTAFNATPRSDVVATRLARYYLRNGKQDQAEETLKKCLEQNPGSKRAHLELARILIDTNEESQKETISYHLKRSFTEGDTNYDAQALYARHEFLFGNKSEADRLFCTLKSQPFAPKFLNRVWGEVHDGAKLNDYDGQVVGRQDSFCFVRITSLGSSLFVHFSEFARGDWENVKLNTLIRCNLGFTLQGPRGINARVVS
jgi:tetratricopeptide (TPR) repeat protein